MTAASNPTATARLGLETLRDGARNPTARDFYSHALDHIDFGHYERLCIRHGPPAHDKSWLSLSYHLREAIER